MAPITHFARAESGADLVLFIVFLVVAGIVNLAKKAAATKGNTNGPGTPIRPHANPGTKDLEKFLKDLSGIPQSEEAIPPPVPPPPIPTHAAHATPSAMAAARRNARKTRFTPRTGKPLAATRPTEFSRTPVEEEVPEPPVFQQAFQSEVPIGTIQPAGHETGLQGKGISGRELMTALRDVTTLKEAVLLREILGPPIALKPIASKPGTIS